MDGESGSRPAGLPLSSDDQFNATTPFTRRLNLPAANVSNCIVAASAQLDQGSKVTVTLLNKP